jgi:hypothetical protein
MQGQWKGVRFQKQREREVLKGGSTKVFLSLWNQPQNRCPD